MKAPKKPTMRTYYVGFNLLHPLAKFILAVEASSMAEVEEMLAKCIPGHSKITTNIPLDWVGHEFNRNSVDGRVLIRSYVTADKALAPFRSGDQ